MAAWALGTVYGKDVPTSGPLFEACEVMGTEVRALFRHADGGLKASGYGKEHGSEALDYYMETKSVVVTPNPENA